MEKARAEDVARFHVLAETVPDADRKLVFGSPACLVGGTMFFGVHAAGVFVKLPEADAAELLAAGGEPFEPMPGRAMGGLLRAARRRGAAGALGRPSVGLRARAATQAAEGGQEAVRRPVR